METLIEGADTDSLLSGIEARKQRTIQKLQQKYRDHYDGLTSAKLRDADRNLYEAMRRRGLLSDLQPRPRVTERQRQKELRSMYKQMCGQAHRRLTRSELRQVDPNLYKQLHRHNLLHLVPSGERPESPQRESPVKTLEEKILDRVNLLLDRYRNEFAGKTRGWLKKYVSPYYKQLHRAGLLCLIPRLRDVPKVERPRECQSLDPPKMLLGRAQALFDKGRFDACMGVLSHIFNGRKHMSKTIRRIASQLLELCLKRLDKSEVNNDSPPNPIAGRAADVQPQPKPVANSEAIPVPARNESQPSTSSKRKSTLKTNALYDSLAGDPFIAPQLDTCDVRSLCEKLLAASSNDSRCNIFKRQIHNLSIGITRRLLQLLYERNLLDDHHVKKLSESVGDAVSFRDTKLTFGFF